MPLFSRDKPELTLMRRLCEGLEGLNPKLDKLFWVLVIMAGESVVTGVPVLKNQNGTSNKKDQEIVFTEVINK